jgi:hypothetical protein
MVVSASIADAIIEALEATEAFTSEQLLALVDLSDEIQTVKAADLNGFSAAEAQLAERTIRDAVEGYGVIEKRSLDLPEKPPYLENIGTVEEIDFNDLDRDGNPKVTKPADCGDYMPDDETQFVTIGDQSFRWDGKRTRRFPYGERHEIAFIDHSNIGGVLLPNQDQAAEAMQVGKQWFHKGYRCWITEDGKKTGLVSRDRLDAVRRVGSGSSTARVA